jgi:hypothetical protein
MSDWDQVEEQDDASVWFFCQYRRRVERVCSGHPGSGRKPFASTGKVPREGFSL